jgi:hypothetical protein
VATELSVATGSLASPIPASGFGKPLSLCTPGTGSLGAPGGPGTGARRQLARQSLPRARCTNQLPKGTVTAHGLLDLTTKPPFRLAITGGTVAYRDAHREVQVVFDTPDPDHDQVTFRIGH